MQKKIESKLKIKAITVKGNSKGCFLPLQLVLCSERRSKVILMALDWNIKSGLILSKISHYKPIR